MRILTAVQQRDASPGVIVEVTAAEGHELGEWTPAEAPPPADLDDHDAALVLLRSKRAEAGRVRCRAPAMRDKEHCVAGNGPWTDPGIPSSIERLGRRL